MSHFAYLYFVSVRLFLGQAQNNIIYRNRRIVSMAEQFFPGEDDISGQSQDEKLLKLHKAIENGDTDEVDLSDIQVNHSTTTFFYHFELYCFK